MAVIEIDTLTPYPAACLVRDENGRPKTQVYGGVPRGRVSSQAKKRAWRCSSIWQDLVGANAGVRTRLLGTDIYTDLVVQFGEQKADEAILAVAKVFGSPDEKKGGGALSQLVYLSPAEIDAAAEIARKLAAGETVDNKVLKELIAASVNAVDIAAFGRMFASRPEMRLTAAVSVAHDLTVGRIQMESDFYVAKDDRASDDDLGAGFMGNQEFLAGLFYGYVRIDTTQMSANLGGDLGLTRIGIEALVKSIPQVSPTGKSASFGSHSQALWTQVRISEHGLGTLAGAVLDPVAEGDQLVIAKTRMETLANNMAKAFGLSQRSEVMDVIAGRGTLADLTALALSAVPTVTE